MAMSGHGPSHFITLSFLPSVVHCPVPSAVKSSGSNNVQQKDLICVRSAQPDVTSTFEEQCETTRNVRRNVSMG